MLRQHSGLGLLGFRVSSFGFRVSGFGFRVSGPYVKNPCRSYGIAGPTVGNTVEHIGFPQDTVTNFLCLSHRQSLFSLLCDFIISS